MVLQLSEIGERTRIIMTYALCSFANFGSLGVFDAKYLIRLMLANALRFDKFGA